MTEARRKSDWRSWLRDGASTVRDGSHERGAKKNGATEAAPLCVRIKFAWNILGNGTDLDSIGIPPIPQKEAEWMGNGSPQ
jgi:hypothetical protein